MSKAAVLINTPLVQQEDDISEMLEATAYEVGLLAARVTFSQCCHHISMFFTADGAGSAADWAAECPAGV